jgi:hypothetical protein
MLFLGCAASVVACVPLGAGTLPDEVGGTQAPEAETAKLVTEDAPPVDPGATEIELGYQFGGAKKAYDSANKITKRGTLAGQIFLLKVTHGIADGLDAAVEVEARDLLKDEEKQLDDGAGNVHANVKWRLWESEAAGVTLSWLPGFTAPFSEPSENEPILSPGQDYWSLNNLVAFTVHGERVTWSLDAGYVLPIGDHRDDDRGELQAGAALGYQLCSWLQPVVELNYAHGYVKNAPDADSFAATGGAILNVSDAVRLDLGAQQTFYGRNTDTVTRFLANLSVTF